MTGLEPAPPQTYSGAQLPISYMDETERGTALTIPRPDNHAPFPSRTCVLPLDSAILTNSAADTSPRLASRGGV